MSSGPSASGVHRERLRLGVAGVGVRATRALFEGGLVVEEGSQLFRQLRVAGQERGPVGRPARLHGGVVGGDGLVQALLNR
jgi:hypothetical protein